MKTEGGGSTAHVEDPGLDRWTGEFVDDDTELRFRRSSLAESGMRLSRSAFYLAAGFVAFTISDLSSAGFGRTWGLLFVARVLAAAGLVLLAVRLREDPTQFADGPGTRLLVASQLGVLLSFLLVCAVRPDDVVTHVVSAVFIALVVGILSPGSVRSKAWLIGGFEVAFGAVAFVRFSDAGLPLDTVAVNLAAGLVFTYIVMSNLNRAQRVEWWATAQQREANGRLAEQVRRAELLRVELQRQATQDPLTGLANRRSFFSGGDDLLALDRRADRPTSVVLMDADGFKQVNDVYGHSVGDAVLAMLGSALRSTARDGELVARIGGEEFAVIASGVAAEGGTALGDRLRRAAGDAEVVVDGCPIRVTVSVGVAEVSSDETLASALKRADRWMYEAKRAGGDRVTCDGRPPGGRVSDAGMSDPHLSGTR